MSKQKHNLNGIFVSSNFKGSGKAPKRAKKLRRDTERHTKVDPFTGKKISSDIKNETSTIKPDGSVHRVKDNIASTWDCFCPLAEPFGGVCFDTGANVCGKCLLTCAYCGKPISKQAAHPFEDVVLCFEDFEKAKSRSFFRSLWKSLFGSEE